MSKGERVASFRKSASLRESSGPPAARRPFRNSQTFAINVDRRLACYPRIRGRAARLFGRLIYRCPGRRASREGSMENNFHFATGTAPSRLLAAIASWQTALRLFFRGATEFTLCRLGKCGKMLQSTCFGFEYTGLLCTEFAEKRVGMMYVRKKKTFKRNYPVTGYSCLASRFHDFFLSGGKRYNIGDLYTRLFIIFNNNKNLPLFTTNTKSCDKWARFGIPAVLQTNPKTLTLKNIVHQK